MVDTSNSGSGVIALGLKARDESSNSGWKRFRNDAVLSVTYNDVPNAPVGLRTSGTTCFTSPDINSPGIPVLGTNSQTLAATANDPNGDNLHEYFEVWNWHGSYIRTLDTGTRAPGVQFSAQTGALPDGTYAWRAVAKDSWAWGPWSAWCDFTIDTVKPGLPAVSSSQFPEGALGAQLGTPGTFTLGAAGTTDVKYYKYAFNSDTPSTRVDVAALGGSASVTFSPAQFGTNFVTVQSFDRADNPSPVRRYVFKVAGGNPTAQWFFDEGSGASAASNPNSFPLTIAGGVTWTAARERLDEFGFPAAEPGFALAFDGVSGAANTGVGQPVQTDRSFSVSAWVNVDPETAADASAVSQDGVNVGGFRLGYEKATDRYTFALAAADSTTTTWAAANADSDAQTGRWTHLVGVYDHEAKSVRLYVDGRLAGSVAAYRSPWNASGTLRLGSLVLAGNAVQHWRGGIDDVQVFRGPIDSASVEKLFTESRVS